MRHAWTRLLLIASAVLAVWACDATYRIVITMPWCPVKDSLKRVADSIPVMCLFPDTGKDTTR